MVVLRSGNAVLHVLTENNKKKKIQIVDWDMHNDAWNRDICRHTHETFRSGSETADSISAEKLKQQ